MTETPATGPAIKRVRHELRRRELAIAAVEQLTPAVIRVTMSGPELAEFVSAAPDDHLKLFLPVAGGEPVMRDYTPRRYDAEAQKLIIDVVDHVGGPAADWARNAKAGDAVVIGGPRGSAVIEGPMTNWLLIGDETALPAIGRRIEELGSGVGVTSLVAVPSREDEQVFSTEAMHLSRWVHRPLELASTAAPLLGLLSEINIRENCFCWVAAEAGVARALRDALLERGVPRNWIKASGYWVKGQSDASVKAIED